MVGLHLALKASTFGFGFIWYSIDEIQRFTSIAWESFYAQQSLVIGKTEFVRLADSSFWYSFVARFPCIFLCTSGLNSSRVLLCLGFTCNVCSEIACCRGLRKEKI